MIADRPDIASERAHRGTLFLEDAEVVEVRNFPANQFVVRLRAPRTAERAVPGSFVHIRCDDAIPMRRPLSIMLADRTEGCIEVLFKIVGGGLRSLAHRIAGDRVSLIGPIGHGFEPHRTRTRPLLVGGGVGIPPMVFLGEQLARNGTWRPYAVLGSEIPFPFETTASTLPFAGVPGEVDATMPFLEDRGIPARLASLADFPGTYRGYVTDLARAWLATLSAAEIDEVEVFGCGPTPMLRAVAALAREFDLPCQVSLEEFMACAVGGCAGCTVLVQTADGPAMKRVCVDGPVFDAAQVFAE